MNRQSKQTIFLCCVFGLFISLIASPAATAEEMCNGKIANIVGTEGDDVLRGTDGQDVIAGLGGNDILVGKDGKDDLCGGEGDDILRGGDGRDFLDGGNGNDTLRGNDGKDIIIGGKGDDILRGNDGKDIIIGGEGNDNIRGNDGTDTCDGGIGIDTAKTCETESNTGLIVKQVQITVPGGFIPVGGPLAGQNIPALDGALFIPENAKSVAMIATHGTFGSFATSLTGWIGWWAEREGIAVLTLNRRDSISYGDNEGGGGTIYEDTLCDVGLGIDFLISLGFDQVIVQGHSKGTTVSPMYPVYYNNCPGRTGQIDPNDPNVAGVITTGTIRNAREAGIFAPFGSAAIYDSNAATANNLVATGFSGVLFPPGGFPAPPFPPIPVFGPQFFAQPPGVPFPFPFTATPDSYVSYNDNPLRNTNETAKDLVVPYLIIHTEGDGTTPQVWSDTLFAELQANGNDVEYFQQAYASLGYDLGNVTGANAHQIANADARDEAVEVINDWAANNIGGSQTPATGLDQAAIDALPDFIGLEPTPSVP